MKLGLTLILALTFGCSGTSADPPGPDPDSAVQAPGVKLDNCSLIGLVQDATTMKVLGATAVDIKPGK